MPDWFLTQLQPWSAAPWLKMSPLEIAATATLLWSVVAAARVSLWSWPTGLVAAFLYMLLFWPARLYSDTALQVVYIVLQVYGWWQWLHGGAGRRELAITRTSPRQWLALGLGAGAAFVPAGYLLGRYTDTDVPWWDAGPTVSSLVAQWLLSRKKLENWWVWIASDLVYIPLFAYKKLWLTAGVYGVLLILCVLGARRWTREYRSSAAA